MSENIEIVLTEDYLLVTLSGAFSTAAAMKSVDALKEVCGKAGSCTKVLFDLRVMTGEMPIFDKYKIGQYGAELLPGTIRIAMLGREDQIAPDKFFENVAVNRGLTLKVFTDKQEALAWLKG